MLLLSIGALTLVGCSERGILEGDPPLTLQAPTLPTLQPSATPPEPTATTAVVGQIVVSVTATSIIPPAVTATPVDSSTGVINTGTVSGTAAAIAIPPTRTQSPSEILSATLQALTALNSPTETPANPITSTVPTPTTAPPIVTTPASITTTAAVTQTGEVTVEQPTANPQPTIPTPTPLPTVPTATPIPITTITPLPDKSNLYVVREGETLESIGTDWGVPTVALASANALPITAVLTPGQPIVIPIDQIIIPTPTLIVLTATPTPSTTTTSTITSTGTTTGTVDTPPPTIDATGEDIPETHSPPPNSPFNPNNYFVHVVESGETIYRIAIRYGFTEQELIDYNQLEYNAFRDNYLIYPGDELKIPLRE